MRKKLNLLPSLVGIGLLVVASGALAADAPSAPASGEAKLGGLPQLLGALKDIQIPSLTGLIQPEKMGLLTDNACRISDNEAQLLSDNEAQLMSENKAQLMSDNKAQLMSDNKADRDFQSGNSLDVLSNIRLLSDITVTVQVTVHQGEAKAAKPKKNAQARRQNKAKQEKARAEKAKADKAKADTAARAKKKNQAAG